MAKENLRPRIQENLVNPINKICELSGWSSVQVVNECVKKALPLLKKDIEAELKN